MMLESGARVDTIDAYNLPVWPSSLELMTLEKHIFNTAIIQQYETNGTCYIDLREYDK
ncbi:unnamed protein product, partial [Rotaria socialis]